MTGVTLAPPPPVPTNPVIRLRGDLRAERRVRTQFPPGDTGFSMARTRAFAANPLAVLLDAHARFGPVFTVRIFHGNTVYVLGPEANHFVLVSHAHLFSWREGHMNELWPLLGDGLLTVDGEFHRASRKAMLPAFGRERVLAATRTMVEETAGALDGLRPGTRLDLYAFTRRLAMRIALRALFGLRSTSVDAARAFEEGLGFYARDYALQVLRGPGTPFARMQRARRTLDALVLGEIARRRRAGERGEDLLSLLLDTELDDAHVRDEVMTLLFAGHDTTTSSVAFLVHELARAPHERARVEAERDAVLGGREATPADLTGTTLPLLERAIDETLRKFPPAWVGPRRSVAPFELGGVRVPAGVPVNYSSWASHHLPDVFGDPEVFRPDRFAPEARAALPKGAYVPFGGGSRTCLGMRFGQAEVRAIAAALLGRFRLELDPGFALRTRQMPTIGPRDGLPVTVHAR